MVQSLLNVVRQRLRQGRPEAVSPAARHKSAGQALVEFTLVVPTIGFILLGVLDMSRVFTSQLAVESAAREAADFGAFNSDRWLGLESDPTSNYAKTLAAMEERAGVASRPHPRRAQRRDGAARCVYGVLQVSTPVHAASSRRVPIWSGSG